jgi:hypothetical protein
MRQPCRYLPLYIDMITHSTNEQCLDKWVRIVMHMIGMVDLPTVAHIQE